MWPRELSSLILEILHLNLHREFFAAISNKQTRILELQRRVEDRDELTAYDDSRHLSPLRGTDS
jgi:hypothetical protein